MILEDIMCLCLKHFQFWGLKISEEDTVHVQLQLV